MLNPCWLPIMSRVRFTSLRWFVLVVAMLILNLNLLVMFAQVFIGEDDGTLKSDACYPSSLVTKLVQIKHHNFIYFCCSHLQIQCGYFDWNLLHWNKNYSCNPSTGGSTVSRSPILRRRMRSTQPEWPPSLSCLGIQYTNNSGQASKSVDLYWQQCSLPNSTLVHDPGTVLHTRQQYLLLAKNSTTINWFHFK